MIVYILVYLAACALVASLGTNRRFFGYWGYFFIALFTTPIPVLIILLLTLPKTPKTSDG
jgi:hypothetical protein